MPSSWMAAKLLSPRDRSQIEYARRLLKGRAPKKSANFMTFAIIIRAFLYEMRTSSDVINEHFPQTVADILRNSELPGPLEALER